jgi:H+-translocating NAD(P) transhydrogenase subunit beta
MAFGTEILTPVACLAATLFFFLGLKRLSSPLTAPSGNLLAAVGMGIAVLGTFLDPALHEFLWPLSGIAVGSVLGLILAKRTAMTAMPQMVSLLNGLGGASSAAVALGEYYQPGHEHSILALVTILAGVLVGGATFSGSLIAFAKLEGKLTGSLPAGVSGAVTSGSLLGAFLLGSVLLVTIPTTALWMPLVLTLLSLALGISFVMAIGGGDMPVAIAFLNSCSGIAAGLTGFILNNDLLLIAGALVGASGLILTAIMCKAMNRSWLNVLLPAARMASGEAKASTGDVQPIDAESVAMMLGYAQSVVIVPGYGLAVAQAQHGVRELANQLESRGVSVRYAIHPVAGRMPGHMNVLLAEVDVPYSQFCELEDINPEFDRVDVALVIGANDVVNPAARGDRTSPLFGMPILDVDRARRVVVVKRGMKSGYSGVENDLFYQDNTNMLFGDARKVLENLVLEVKQLA